MARAVVVVGLGYGDEGKGTMVDWLARERAAELVVRFNGGAQAGHNVVLPDGRHHTFSQFGAGTFAGARTFLSRHVLVNPVTALSEAGHLSLVGVVDPLSLLSVEDEALVTTPLHVAANRIREMCRGDGRHGSCGMGIGETVAYAQAHQDEAVRVRDLCDSDRVRGKLLNLQDRLICELCSKYPGEVIDGTAHPRFAAEWDVLVSKQTVDRTLELFAAFSKKVSVVDRDFLPEQLRASGTAVFEGAQGVLLDQDYGFHPHTTWSSCTFENALELVHGLDVEVFKLGVLRTYHTRHGVGPFVSEVKALRSLEGDHNTWGPWQENFRVGGLDLVATRYALDVTCGVDGLALTHCDQLNIPLCVGYAGLPILGTADPVELFEGFGHFAYSIKAERRVDLARQGRITEALLNFRPVFAPDDPSPGEIAERLGVELSATSSGPTYEQKEAR